MKTASPFDDASHMLQSSSQPFHLGDENICSISQAVAAAKQYFHIYANGDDSRNFIVSEEDRYAAFNRAGICASEFPEADVLSFGIEDSHPHFLLYGTFEDCFGFKREYETLTIKHIVKTRGSIDGVSFKCEISMVDNGSYLKDVGTYTIIQPTKDGQRVMPYDYLWGTGCLYFRSNRVPPVWMFDEDGQMQKPVRMGDLSENQRRRILHSNRPVPSNWQVCNGFLLPTNYVNVRMFEAIYRTHNCFRVFLCHARAQERDVITRMAEECGVSLEDQEARILCKQDCRSLFGFGDPRRLCPTDRIRLAETLRTKHRLSFRQIATLVRLPESEVRKYVR